MVLKKLSFRFSFLKIVDFNPTLVLLFSGNQATSPIPVPD
jgi:hypothetical protein